MPDIGVHGAAFPDDLIKAKPQQQHNIELYLWTNVGSLSGSRSSTCSTDQYKVMYQAWDGIQILTATVS